MKNKKINKTTSSLGSKRVRGFIALAILLLVVAGSVVALEKKGVINLRSDKTQPTVIDTDTKTTSSSPTAQETFTEGTDRTPTTNPARNEGHIFDNSGNINNLPPESQWSKSKSGALVVYSPAKGAILTSGQSLSGQSNSNTVSFRLIDNVSGVIAEGELKVVSGKFSGAFSFNTEGSEGRLDVFTVNPDSTESNNVEIPVRFK